jgi:TRAP-type C4-dicarboxylate transport system substrate-binding protein
MKAAQEAAEAHREYVDKVNAVGNEYLESEGVTFHTVDNVADFKARMDAVYEIFEDDIGAELIERVKSY